MKYKILKSAFAIWVILWLTFIARELLSKGSFYDYKILLSRSLEGKRSYVTGDRFYEFLAFCDKRLPLDANYEWIGLDEASLVKRRATYYLYPHFEKKDGAEFILVYDKLNISKIGYGAFAKLDDGRYILRRRKER